MNAAFETFGSAKFNFDVQFFIVAITVILNIVIIFMYPGKVSKPYRIEDFLP